MRNPPPGVAFAVQIDRDKLLEPSHRNASALTFDTSIKMAEGKSRTTTLSGPAIQGRGDEKFVYVNSGKRAGQASSCWDRRAKIMLADIDPKTVKQLSDRGGTLLAEINGTSGDGGPCCARVAILNGGWRFA